MIIISKIRGLFLLARSAIRGLSEEDVDSDPMVQFNKWFHDAKRSGIFLPEAVTLATATPDGKPSARMMLLKGADERGFVIYTNFESNKGRQLDANPQAALVLHWSILERQVRIQGAVERVTEAESAAYFKTRLRGSRIGAWASAQSSVLESRTQLEQRVKEYEQKFKGDDIPLPPFWGGYRVIPERIEFWQGRLNRLHDRIVYEREGETWKISRLSP
ncbi:MAG: pyridoxamine 5'-phosphate oxidase [Verrucomicrobia bacterium]|nr:pyridoxamine 5'-phosphate oxidase [Verrucomicrobiota bacterium]